MEGRYTAEKYIELINNSIIYNINKEQDYALYQAESTKFIGLLYEYFIYYSPKKIKERAKEFGAEFMKAAEESLRYYDKSKGEFLHYFNKVFSQKYTIESAKQKAKETRGGLHITDEDSKLISKILKYNKSIDIDDLSTEQLAIISAALNITIERLKELIDENKNAVAVGNVVNTDDGEVDLFDKCAVVDDNIEQEDSIIEQLNRIEDVYTGLQNRGKTNQIISTLLTIDIIKSVSDIIKLDQLNFNFIDKNIIKTFKIENRLLSNKEIAKLYDVSEPSLSRTYSSFKKKLT